jgi:hypothetical protein
MIHVRDLFDEASREEIKDDLLSECKKFGDVISFEIPVPMVSVG